MATKKFKNEQGSIKPTKDEKLFTVVVYAL
jgi:hypothetical protein